MGHKISVRSCNKPNDDAENYIHNINIPQINNVITDTDTKYNIKYSIPDKLKPLSINNRPDNGGAKSRRRKSNKNKRTRRKSVKKHHHRRK
jgi:hypothetical protein